MRDKLSPVDGPRNCAPDQAQAEDCMELLAGCLTLQVGCLQRASATRISSSTAAMLCSDTRLTASCSPIECIGPCSKVTPLCCADSQHVLSAQRGAAL